MAEFTEASVKERVEEQNMDGKLVGVISVQEYFLSKVYVDGATNHRGSGVGLVLVSLEKITIEKSLRLGFSTTNNEANMKLCR